MVRDYTVRRHIRRLKYILNKDNICELCPANILFNPEDYKGTPWMNNPCKVCLTFVGLKYKHFRCCPCFQLGMKEAVRITLKAIEKFRLKSQ